MLWKCTYGLDFRFSTQDNLEGLDFHGLRQELCPRADVSFGF